MKSRAAVPILAAILAIGVVVACLWTERKSEPGRYVVTSGSMSPAYPVGSQVYVVPASTYTIGDVVLVDRPEFSKPVLHRIVAIGGATVTTKGDANNEADAPISISRIVGKVYP